MQQERGCYEDARLSQRDLLPTAHITYRQANEMGFNPSGGEETYFRPSGQEGSIYLSKKMKVWAAAWDCCPWCQPALVSG